MIRLKTNTVIKTVKSLVHKGSGLNSSPSEDITDAMLFEDGSEFYMIEEDSVDYLQLVELM